MYSQNQAAWVDAAKSPVRVAYADRPVPGPDEVLIQNAALAINPVDWKMQESGHYIKSWPTILGCDTAGTVVEVGDNVSHISKAQRVLGQCVAILTGDTRDAGFQNYTTVPALLVSPIPNDMSFEKASVLPLAISTAAAGLFQSDMLALPLPTAQPKLSGRTILVWGASSSVGTLAVQLASAAGLEVVVTSSQKNFGYCMRLGAKAVYDYTSSSMVSDLTEALRKCEFAGAFDAIGVPDTITTIASILAQLGGGTIVSVLRPPEERLPANVEAKRIFAFSIGSTHKEIGKAIYEDFVPQALASGQLKPLPEAIVVGTGLDQIQGAMEKLKAGISAAKLVVAL